MCGTERAKKRRENNWKLLVVGSIKKMTQSLKVSGMDPVELVTVFCQVQKFISSVFLAYPLPHKNKQTKNKQTNKQTQNPKQKQTKKNTTCCTGENENWQRTKHKLFSVQLCKPSMDRRLDLNLSEIWKA